MWEKRWIQAFSKSIWTLLFEFWFWSATYYSTSTSKLFKLKTKFTKTTHSLCANAFRTIFRKMKQFDLHEDRRFSALKTFFFQEILRVLCFLLILIFFQVKRNQANNSRFKSKKEYGSFRRRMITAQIERKSSSIKWKFHLFYSSYKQGNNFFFLRKPL